MRIVSIRVRPETVFERVATPGEAADLLAVVEAGRPGRAPVPDAATGAGAGWVMAAFLKGGAARFNDADVGAFYAARDEATARAETQYHWARFLGDAREPHTLFGALVLHATVSLRAVDIRGRTDRQELYDPDPARYGPAQRWGVEQRAAGADGVVYDSVRRPGGECVAVFRPSCVTRCRVAARIAYEWDGEAFSATHTLTPRP